MRKSIYMLILTDKYGVKMEIKIQVPKGVPSGLIKSRVESLVRGEISRFQLLEEIISRMALDESDIKEFEKTREIVWKKSKTALL